VKKLNKKAKNTLMGVIISLVLLGLLLASFSMAAPKACNDKIDNDGDGYTDYPNDPGCSSRQDNSELDPSVECDDGSDNDGDGDTDYNDGGCSGPTDDDETNCGDEVCEGPETSGNCPEDCGYSDSCEDTDGGNYPFTFGTTSGYYNEIPYSNDDYCVDSSNIMEYYCSGDYEQSQQQSCGTDGYGSPYCMAGGEIWQNFTDYSCASGECNLNITPTFQEDCDDNDGYGSNYCNNSWVDRDYYNYYCTGGACDYNQYSEHVEWCPWGCTAGECDEMFPPNSCLETDSGWDLPTAGTTYGNYSEIPYSYDDVCLDGDLLMEYYCSGDNYQYSNASCLGMNYTGCASGACY